AFSFGPVTNSLKGEFTAGLFLEYLADQGSTIRVDFDEVSLSVIPKSESIRPALVTVFPVSGSTKVFVSLPFLTLMKTPFFFTWLESMEYSLKYSQNTYKEMSSTSVRTPMS
ncbi:MAG TPA: hypothetical protein VM123_19760, partial [archaeon]|nr:hypothetical protein [archaeon]